MGWSAAPETAVPVDQEPLHRLVLKNDYVVVLHVTIPPGQSTRVHTHAHDGVAVRLSDSTVSSDVPGKAPTEPRRTRVRATSRHSTTREQPLTHRVNNARHDAVRGHRPRVPEAPGRPADAADRPSGRRERERPRLPLGPRPGSLDPAAHPRASLPHHRGDADAARDEVAGRRVLEHPIKAGDFHWVDGRVTHVLTNNGTQAGVIVEVELK